MRLSEIQMVNPNKLQHNQVNRRFFKAETGQYFDKLAADIKKRGILVPLVAKQDGTLLAGHNRLLVAQTLKIAKVPVQYVVGKIAADEEKEFIIKDNLLRRHLAPAERMALYRLIIPKFDERIEIERSAEMGVSASEIAEKTGLNPKTVNYDLTRARRMQKKLLKDKMEVDTVNDKIVDNYKRSVARMINMAIVEKGKTVKELIQITETALERLRGLA